MEPREFTRQLLARLAGPCPAAPAAGRTAFPEGPWILMVTDLAAADALPLWREAAALRNLSLSLAVLAEGDAGQRLMQAAVPDRILSPEESLPGEIRAGLKAVLAAPSRDLLVRAALGLGDRPVAEVVLQGLWQGLPVYMDFSCVLRSGGTPCASPALDALYRRYMEHLIALGVKPVNPGDRLTALAEDIRPRPDTHPPAPAGRRVVTQRDVLDLESAAEWVLPRGTIVTHLARDAAKRRGMLLRVEDAPFESSE